MLQFIKEQETKKEPHKLARLNRANRAYFGIFLGEMAKEIGVSSSELSGYEVGCTPMTEQFILKCERHWSEKFAWRK